MRFSDAAVATVSAILVLDWVATLQGPGWFFGFELTAGGAAGQVAGVRGPRRAEPAALMQKGRLAHPAAP